MLIINKIKYKIKQIFQIGKRNNAADLHMSSCTFELEDKYYATCKLLKNRQSLLTCLPSRGIVAELGVDEGDFSEKIMKFNQPSKLFLIDKWNTDRYGLDKYNKVQQKFRNEITEGKIEIKLSYSIDAASQFTDHYFDWIYIDTDHSFETTMNELEAYRTKIKNGGVIAGHDFCEGNVKAGISYGVREAVYEFCIKYNWEILYLTMELNSKPSFALRKKEGRKILF